MFDNDKYVTSGIADLISVPLQILLWSLIDSMNVTQKDYLQVFELREGHSDGKRVQGVVHTQEQPEYRKEHLLLVEGVVSAKIFVIDDGKYSTMLLSSEY